MKQIIQAYKNGRISLAEVPEPGRKAGGALVRTAASLISPGTEKLRIEGVVLEVGEGVQGFRLGGRVAVAGSVPSR